MQKLSLTPRSVLVGALVVAAVGVLIEFLAGVPGFPPVPPGPFMLGGAALAVALIRWRWIPILGVAVAMFVLGGTILAGTTFGLFLGAPAAQILGAVLQLAGLVAAVVSGIVALVRPRPRVDRSPA